MRHAELAASPSTYTPAVARESKWRDLSDDELARHCTTELAGCMDELLGRYDRTIRDCARRMAIDPGQADDLAQEIFLRVVASLPRFEGRSAFATWLYRLAHNTCIDEFRREVRAQRRQHVPRPDDAGGDDLLDSLPASWGDPGTGLDERIKDCYLAWTLSQLPADYREVIRLRLAEGRPAEEVAAILGTTVDAVKAKLKRARRRLRDDLASPRACPFCGRLGAFSAEAGTGLR